MLAIVDEPAPGRVPDITEIELQDEDGPTGRIVTLPTMRAPDSPWWRCPDDAPLSPLKRAFLTAYAASGCNVTAAARACNMWARTHYRWLKEDGADDNNPNEYGEWFAIAHQAGIERLEREADRRATDGVDEPIYHLGQLVGFKRKYSDVLLIFRLKALAPDRYNDRLLVNARNENKNLNLNANIDMRPDLEKRSGLLGELEAAAQAQGVAAPPIPEGPTKAVTPEDLGYGSKGPASVSNVPKVGVIDVESIITPKDRSDDEDDPDVGDDYDPLDDLEDPDA